MNDINSAEMEKYFIAKTFNTPEINFLPEEGLLSITGRSIPEDPGELFDKLISKIEEYYKNPQKITKVDIKLEYVNSGSAKYLLELMRIFKKHYLDNKECVINWYYEEDDESIYELGLHYQNTIPIPFKLIDYY